MTETYHRVLPLVASDIVYTGVLFNLRVLSLLLSGKW